VNILNKSDTVRGKITLSLEQRLIDKLKALAKSTRIPQSRLIDEAIEDLIEKYGGGN
jgi:predicted DNA-binding protein